MEFKQMDDDEDRKAVLAAMYQDDDDDAVPDTDVGGANNYAHPPLSHGITRRVRVGAIEYELPTVEYVQSLERRLAQQNDVLLQQRRLIDRLAAVLGRTQSAQRLHLLKTDELRRELSTKLTVRSSTSSTS